MFGFLATEEGLRFSIWTFLQFSDLLQSNDSSPSAIPLCWSILEGIPSLQWCGDACQRQAPRDISAGCLHNIQSPSGLTQISSPYIDPDLLIHKSPPVLLSVWTQLHHHSYSYPYSRLQSALPPIHSWTGVAQVTPTSSPLPCPNPLRSAVLHLMPSFPPVDSLCLST